jgi:hypothetical protein
MKLGVLSIGVAILLTGCGMSELHRDAKKYARLMCEIENGKKNANFADFSNFMDRLAEFDSIEKKYSNPEDILEFERVFREEYENCLNSK